MNLFDVPQPRIPVSGNERVFPVHRIYCVGRNYAAHAREMGEDPARDPPFYFMKPADVVVPLGGEVRYPPRTNDLHYEIELVVALGTGGQDIKPEDVEKHVFGYAVGIDLTRRDLQAEAKKQGRPWDPGKSFEQAAPISAIHAATDVGHPSSGRIWLDVNGKNRQDGDLGDMIWNVRDAIADLSTLYTLAPGDLLFTGTPAGVGAVAAGDSIKGGIDGLDEIEITLID